MKFGKLILRKIIKIHCHQMSHFKAKMHRIRFRLGMRPRPRWESYRAPPDPVAGFKGIIDLWKNEPVLRDVRCSRYANADYIEKGSADTRQLEMGLHTSTLVILPILADNILNILILE